MMEDDERSVCIIKLCLFSNLFIILLLIIFVFEALIFIAVTLLLHVAMGYLCNGILEFEYEASSGLNFSDVPFSYTL